MYLYDKLLYTILINEIVFLSNVFDWFGNLDQILFPIRLYLSYNINIYHIDDNTALHWRSHFVSSRHSGSLLFTVALSRRIEAIDVDTT